MPLWKHPPTKPRQPCHPTKPHAARACEQDARSSQPPELAVQHAHSQERGGLPQTTGMRTSMVWLVGARLCVTGVVAVSPAGARRFWAARRWRGGRRVPGLEALGGASHGAGAGSPGSVRTSAATGAWVASTGC